ncbi:MAG: hypothetical protein QOG73_2763 [Acetobacteraceae bacterium]|jgi:uncharacterized membrane protein|nr:hypothetical protein [Acetobacteraceae bacterium]
MSYAMRQLHRAQRAVARESSRGSGISTGWCIAGITVGALVMLLFAANAKDIARYIKISSM